MTGAKTAVAFGSILGAGFGGLAGLIGGALSGAESAREADRFVAYGAALGGFVGAVMTAGSLKPEQLSSSSTGTVNGLGEPRFP